MIFFNVIVIIEYYNNYEILPITDFQLLLRLSCVCFSVGNLDHNEL